MSDDRYLNLLKSTLLNEVYLELEAQLLFSVLCAAENVVMDLPEFWDVRKDHTLLGELLKNKSNGDTVVLETGSSEGRAFANARLRNYTEFSYTLVGRKRLDHLQQCVETILDEAVPGDLLEAGVWRGGCCILMRAVLASRGCTDRSVWVCDSFEGLPESVLEADKPYVMSADRLPFLAVSQNDVASHFRRFDLLDEKVKFLPGWFNESFVNAPIEQLALLRIDADLYDSTHCVLQHLYPKVSSGGWVVIDDYRILPPCRQAVDDYREKHDINEPIQVIDEHAVCWRRD